MVFSINVSSAIKGSLSSALGVDCVEEHGLYLGIPIHVGTSKLTIFEYLQERLMKKLVSGHIKFLSSAGKDSYQSYGSNNSFVCDELLYITYEFV